MADEKNIYRAPESDLTHTGERNAKRFYVVSQRKFLIMFFATFGAYSVFWFYQHFKLNNEYQRGNNWPVARAIFSIFFVHGLFEAMQQHLDKAGRAYGWNHRNHATWYVLAVVLARVIDRLTRNSDNLLAAVSLLAMPIAGYFLLQAQYAANTACLNEGDDINDKLSVANYVWITLGLLFWVMILVGIFAITKGQH